MRELRPELANVPIEGEHDARERAWEVVRAAFEAQEPVSRPRRRARPVLALAAGLAALGLVGAALSPPGRAVLDSLREAVGVERAQPALFSLPAPGRLLVVSDRGAWVVQPDGSKRLLGRYREASWSPHGLFVAAARSNELAALEPDGDVRWTLARPRVRFPRWGGTRVDTRIAYVSGRALRVVPGDGTGDRLLAPAAPGPLAWHPRRLHVLTYVSGAEIVTEAVDARAALWRATLGREAPVQLAWSSDGRRLLALSRRSITLYNGSGRRLEEQHLPPGAIAVSAAFGPGTHRAALVLRYPAQDRSELRVGSRRVFAGAGSFTDVAWSPDGRWLLLAWKSADQWLFIRSAGVRKVEAVSNVSAQFRSTSFPTLAGWCCPAS